MPRAATCPTPGSPTTVTSAQRRLSSTRASNAARSSPSSCRAGPRAVLRRATPGALRTVEQPERRHRLRLPLQLERLQLLDRDRVPHQRPRRLAEQDLARRRRLLQPRRHVDRIAGHERLVALVTTSPVFTPIRASELAAPRQRLPASPPPPARPHRVVLVHHRHPEHRHHRVADELLHRPAVRARRSPASARSTAPSAPAPPPDPATRPSAVDPTTSQNTTVTVLRCSRSPAPEAARRSRQWPEALRVLTATLGADHMRAVLGPKRR